MVPTVVATRATTVFIRLVANDLDHRGHARGIYAICVVLARAFQRARALLA
jgi:hypothetical protein